MSLPRIPKFTNKFAMTQTNISIISEEFIQDANFHSSLKVLNLTNNKIRNIPKEIHHLDKIEEIYLSGNPFDCDCDMTWMITWLNNVSSVVKDYKQITCGHGKYKGIPIHVLSPVVLGCYPHTWTTAEKAGLSGAAFIVIIVFILTVLGLRKSREVKFLLYYYLRLDTVPKDDKSEDLDGIEYDAFLCYK